MELRCSELECKEVVCVCDGRRLGFVSDLLLDCGDGCIRAVVVPGKGKLGCACFSGEEFVIPWKHICRIGDDIILVDISPGECRHRREKGSRGKWLT